VVVAALLIAALIVRIKGGITVHIQNSGLGDSPLARWQVMAAATPWVIFSLYWEIRGQKRGRGKELGKRALSRGVHSR